ncbi:antiviral innate immune response receptor RIG-I-like [Physella acuta]|uniref:antiviral innate immune response receptor RIG-I-like n=1 Tax=Physella acuta TaxID=109671 RepID=UPI0027DB16BF|nr:antiviral innate immune response receptor RIG-I-like [Physella acuta]
MACYSNFTGDPNHLEELNKLQLSQEESTLSIWKQIIDSHVVESSDVNILTDKNECDDLNVASEENDQDEYFSDGEYTPGNTMKAKNSKLQLRAYQKELAVKALQGLNAVICAPTGSGKTRVATYIIQNHFQRTDGPRKKKVAFLAKTVPLATQQYKSLCKYLPDSLKTICVTGKDKNSSNLRMLLKYNDVLVMTPMILVNNLQRKGLKLSKFTLLVFDECHHTRNCEPYNLLMSDYLKAKLQGTLSHLPQIVGLTASIGIEKSKTLDEAKESVLEVLGNLDAPHMCTVVENKAELRKTVPVPTEEMFSLKELVPDECYTKIIDIVMKLEEHVKQYAKALGDKTVGELAVCAPKAKNDLSYGQWVVKLKKAALSLHMGVNNLTVRHLVMISNYLMAYNFALESFDLIESTDVVKYLKKSFKEYVENPDKTEVEIILCNYFEELVRLSSKKVSTNPNLEILSAIIKQRMANSQDSRCIIFVRTRALAEALADWLNRSELSDLNASVFTGTSASEEKGGMSKDQQEGARFNFEHGYVKILVATSVAEEGIDIANCNLVIKYNKIGNEVTTVQTRGEYLPNLFVS